jgi:hypothetical protein
LRRKAAELAEFETKMHRVLKVPAGDDWQMHIPENKSGDRMFAEWQRLAVAARKEEESR